MENLELQTSIPDVRTQLCILKLKYTVLSETWLCHTSPQPATELKDFMKIEKQEELIP